MAVTSSDTGAVAPLSEQAAQEIESRLISLQRSQADKELPLPLPNSRFWGLVTQLTQRIEIEMDEARRKEGWNTKTDLIRKRMRTIRWAIGSLTQHRLNGFARLATMRTLLQREGNAPEPNWEQHGPAERAFYESVCRSIEIFQKDIDWDTLQNGISTPIIEVSNSGVAPLTDFIQEDKNEQTIPIADSQEDITPPPEFHIDEAWEDDNQSHSSSVPDGFRRIRMLQDLPEPILGPDDNPVDLSVGDVHVCPTLLADALIGGGMAEPADL
ncbi:MAG TPA: hypothetical protein HA345_02620 [Candidatus Thalassarchaeaceae archaeon]|nr:MAG TPA: hypothetical protein D7H94_02610 [Candidatus Poseidoniales archaeon]HIH84282.1 hypothetical protein [Candidatus Thalassarchaeaceae archaeon]|tara:strand:- start:1861 stop:2670 length:810 start_codon:yes stop_codon:yes gene_type:complete